MSINGDATKLVFPLLACLGGLAVGVVTMIAFLNGQYYTIREHEEFRKTLSETQMRVEDHLKRIDQTVVDNQRAVGELQGFIAAHKAAK
jgi:hypothetical protein